MEVVYGGSERALGTLAPKILLAILIMTLPIRKVELTRVHIHIMRILTVVALITGIFNKTSTEGLYH